MISLHTSPLDQPGTGDAGGMNVYILELARRLAERDLAIEIYTRATTSSVPPSVEAAPGVRVHHVAAGPYEDLNKDDLPGQLCTFARELLRVEARHERGYFDLIHSHYWLSGQVGALAKDRWQVPLAHTMHTMAKVKNSALAAGDHAEPGARLLGETQVVKAADVLIANTDVEAKQLINLYDADPATVEVIHPGVDLRRFTRAAAAERAALRSQLDVAPQAFVAMFAGRIQPLKAPDVVVKAAAILLQQRPELRSRLVVPIVGGPSGAGMERPGALVQLAHECGVSDVVRFVPPTTQQRLRDWYAAADVVMVPSYNESFGLVAIEAQACGTPVIASAVGGLPTAVLDGVTGLLVEGHDPADYAARMERLMDSPSLTRRLGEAAAQRALEFSWEATADRTHAVYSDAVNAARMPSFSRG